MSPEQTFMTELVSGRLPALTALILIFLYALKKGGEKIDKMTIAVEAVPLALAAHRAEVSAAHVEIKAHTTAQADRVIGVITDKRLSDMGDAVADVTRAVSDPEIAAAPARRGTGPHRAIR